MEIPPSDDTKDKSTTPRKDMEVEFIVKNLDTGTVFSSKDIDKFIPKASDPVSRNILRRSFKDVNDAESTSKSSAISSPRKEKRGAKGQICSSFKILIITVVAKIWKITRKKSKEKDAAEAKKVVAPP